MTRLPNARKTLPRTIAYDTLEYSIFRLYFRLRMKYYLQSVLLFYFRRVFYFSTIKYNFQNKFYKI